MVAVKQKRPFRQQAAAGPIYVVWLLVLVVSLAAIRSSPAVARAWSYHYEPIAPSTSPAASATEAITTSTPANGPHLSSALLKRAIISDLAFLIAEQRGRPDKAYAERSEDLVQQLSLFDRLDSPAALEEFASLSGYYFGARSQELFDCLSLRKGKAFEPYLEPYIRNGNAECSQKLGQSFTRPGDTLGGFASCPTDLQLKARLTILMAEIDAAKTCSDSNLAAIVASSRASPPHPQKVWGWW